MELDLSRDRYYRILWMFLDGPLCGRAQSTGDVSPPRVVNASRLIAVSAHVNARINGGYQQFQALVGDVLDIGRGPVLIHIDYFVLSAYAVSRIVDYLFLEIGGGEYGGDYCAHNDSAPSDTALGTLSVVGPGSYASDFFDVPKVWDRRQRGPRDYDREGIIIESQGFWEGLISWGMDPSVLEPWRQDFRGDCPGRVVADCGAFFDVIMAQNPDATKRVQAQVAGRLRYHATDPLDMPHIGDFVVLEVEQSDFRIIEVLPRKSALLRKNAGSVTEAQVMAANIDHVLIMAGLNRPLNMAWLERSLALVWDSGANPVIVLTKADLANDIHESLGRAEKVAMGVPVFAISVITGQGIDGLGKCFSPGATMALLGLSGVGKSTLLNYWLGEGLQRVQAVRQDDGRGRHTTTHREIFSLPNGALVVDIPGVREMGLWKGGTDPVFADINVFATACRFYDCQHNREPGCAVQSAIIRGDLAEERLVQYRKLERELDHLERKRSAYARSQARQVLRQRSRQARQREQIHKKGV